MTASNLEHNLKLIPYHQALASSMVYLPVFVLFTRDNFGVSGALQIASLTYLFIVALEVPSGWMSDRLGRVPTLSVAAAGFAIGQVCFLVGGEQFGVIVLGQFFVSSGYAFISGTDVSFHFDSLEALGRSDEYAQRQARISSLSYLVRAGTAIAGGVLGLIDLRLTFAVSLVIALAQLAVTRMLHEPGDGDVRAERFVSQIGKCLAYMRHGFMAWLFFYGIALVVLEHVAFTLMQPWLTEALGKSPDELGATPLVSGGLFAITAFVGAAAARASAPAGERFGTVATLIGLGVVSAVIVTGMALSILVGDSWPYVLSERARGSSAGAHLSSGGASNGTATSSHPAQHQFARWPAGVRSVASTACGIHRRQPSVVPADDIGHFMGSRCALGCHWHLGCTSRIAVMGPTLA